jgi:hypothetical protein
MPILFASPSPSNGAIQPEPARIRGLHGRMRVSWVTGALLAALTAILLGASGCGSGGYPGGGIEALSASAVTIDSGQSYSFAAREEGSPVISWSLTCAAPACGSLSASTGLNVVYMAPAGLTSQMSAKLTALVTGTTSSSTATITVNPDPTLALVTPTATVGAAYAGATNPTGGTAPLTLSLSAGTLPPGLNFNTTTGAVTGTPTTTGTFNFTAQILDSSAVPYTATQPETIVVSAAPIIAVTVVGNPPAGTVQSAYSTTFSATGGTPPYTFSLLSGSLPPGLALLASGVLSGTPTTAGTSNFTVQAEDGVGTKGTAAFSVAIAGIAPTLTLSSPPVGTVGVIYSGTIGVGGGTSPYTCAITGTLPAGLTSNNCTISGTPGTAGTTSLTVTATDSSNPQGKITGPVSLVINPAALSLTLSSLPNGTINVPYSQTIGVAGGTAPYSCTITGGTLQAGLALSGCTVSGTPTVASTVNLTVKASDSSSTQETTVGPVNLTILPAALSLTLSSLPSGTINVPYSQIIGVAGGTAPYSCTITAGTLQAGLTLAGCTVSGTPTVSSTVNLTVKATDSSPTQETTTGPVSLTINPAALSLTLSSLPNGTINVPYSQTIGVAGGTAPYSCTITAGTLQAGLTLTGCTVSGTPTVASTVNLTVKATDSSPTQETTTGPISLTINPAGLSLTLSSLPNGTINVPYSQIIGVAGGTAPYSCTITAGTLQAGLTLTGCTVSGTPTVASTVNLTVKATDSSPTQEPTTGPVSLTINPAAAVIVITSPPAGTVNVPYSGPIGVTGGTGPYTCTLASGTLPAGLTLTGCTITGTPTAPGSTIVTVTVTDSGNPPATKTGPITIVINPAGLSLTLSSLPNGTINVPYSQIIGVAGGTAPYSCTITAGTLQAGLTLTGCTVSGTPTVASTVNLTVKATDSSPTQETTTGPVSLTINPAALSLTLSSLPSGTINVPYSQTIGVAGGTGPYSCTITAGTLQAGLTLSGCTVSGTPTVASTVNLTVKATDSSPTQETTTGPVSLTIFPAGLNLAISSLPNGTINVPYSQTIGVTGGTAPYSCTITAGTLQAGLTLTGCTVSGTPTVASTVNLTVKATDSSPTQETTTGPVSLTINPAPLGLTLTSLPDGTINVPYSQTIGVTGGTAPYSCTITAGTLQAGLTLTGCTVSGTPTVASTVHLAVKATDSSPTQETTTGPVSLTINPAALSLTLTSLPDGTINVPYSETIGVAGGTAPYSCTITAGTLQAGLTLTGCTVSGTPTVASTVHLTVKATDSSPTQETTTGPVSLTINPAPLRLTLTSLPDGTINVPYSQTIGVAGGTAPYSCTITAGTLQAGLTLTGCTVSGTPTVASTVNLTVKATDSSPTQETTTGPVSLTINPAPLKLTLSSLPDGTVNVPYSQTIGVSGGTAPYSCTIVSGTLQQGLSLTGCTVSGTPTVASTVNLSVKATDSSPTQETTTGPVSLTINPAALSLTLSSLPDGTINKPYSAVIGVAGGTAPYSCTITAGTLQAGLTLTGCTVSGTPTVASTVNLTVKATDSSTTQETTTGPVSLTINPAALTLTLSSLPDGTVGTPYSATIGVSGGTAPYSCTITAGTLQAGLSLTGCTVSGTPTVAATANLTVKATDSSPTQETTTGPVSLTINPAAVVIVITSPPAGMVNVPYSGPIGVTGGTGPYTCTLASGTLPAGLTLTGCTITGTPTAPGSTTVTITATDSSNPPATKTGPITIVINPATPTLTLSSPPPATVDTPYTGPIGVSGGTGPYTCVLNSGTVPPGLTLTNCTLTGTPTTAGATVLNITATDSSTPTHATTTGNVTVTVNPLAPLTLTGSLPNATVGVFYTQTITAQGGLPPYTYAITTGTLPQGITLDPTTGVFSGTPTAADVGATSFTETVTDSEGPKQTASLPLVLLVLYPTTANDGELDGPYAYIFQGYDDVVLGVLAYQTATVGSFTADGMGGISLGELDANHQSSHPAGSTILSQDFLGTYSIGIDNRGSLAITVLNPDGTTGHTTIYAIAVRPPVAPATITTEGSLIESDDDQAVGTKGSGTMLAQTATAFTAGLKGSYAFGVSGDTPCLPSCTIGIIAGPVATVGQFTTDSAGAIMSGTSDTNIATTNIANSDLGGTYTAADSNGRLQLSLSTGGTAGYAYPTDYAVYLVDANRAFILSTDKHSAYILLAGSAELQTKSTFTHADMSAPFIGYENSQTNPGLVGATLQNVLNFSTATIFRGTGVTGQTGECDITNVDTGGVTGLLNGLTGIVGDLTGLASILGGADYTGHTTCQTTNTGRGVLAYPKGGLLDALFPPPSARVYYLSSPETGYFLETSYAGLGKFEAQTGSPFSEANTFTGTYVYGMAPASSLASIDSSGIIVSNGAGKATTTLDENVGVGTINVIELGLTSTQAYTAPDPTTGRFTLGASDVIYAITPNRFVLLDINPTATSPSVAVLY